MTAARGAARPRVPGALLPEAADQLHLVGQPQGPRGPEPLRRRLPRARQHRRVRPLQAAARPAATSSRPTAPPGWPSTARRCSRSRSSSPATTRPRGHGLEVLRALRRHRRRHEHASAARACGTRRTASTTTSCAWTGAPSRCKVRSLVGLIPLLAVEVLDDELIQGLPGFKKRMDWFLEHRPDLSRAHLLLLPAGQAARAAATGCWPSRRGSGWSASCATCSMRTSSSRPTASAPCRASTGTGPTSSGSTARSTGWTTSPASPPPASSAATPTGAARSGSRSTTC